MTGDTTCTLLQPKEYKSGVKPVWCPGCGDFGVLGSITKALSGLRIQPENVAIISGIGCSSRMPTYLNTYGFHGVHGRALALATGLKVARPDLTVIATGGDGDGFSIGGNHFLHTCRRNPRYDLYRHGQPGVWHDQGTGIADHRSKLGTGQAHAQRHGNQPVSAIGYRAGFGCQFHCSHLQFRFQWYGPGHHGSHQAPGVFHGAGTQSLCNLPA